jgi:predicted CXXCH cytochrome family protein
LIAVGIIALVVGGVVWFAVFRSDPPAPPAAPPEEDEEIAPDPPPPDPRLTFPTVFRNVKPDVRYVGDARCADCHGDICSSYRAHPMGRSAFTVGSAPPIESYDAAAKNPFQIGAYKLEVTKTADRIVHRVTANDASGAPLPEYARPVALAVGSGTRGRSYLVIENGAVWQSPVSWFSADARWDLSPGFDLGTGGRRPIGGECLFCHVDRVDPVPRTRNRYREPLLPLQAAIGCERCHGPGELHVAERSGKGEAPKVDTSIVNPKRLAPALRSAVCEQCHLQGQERVTRRGRELYEFRPGLPFEQFVTVFVRHPDLADLSRSVGQFEQLEQSRCRSADGERLACTSCHDPHSTPAPADRARFYRARCAACHEAQPAAPASACSAPLPERRAGNDACAACHMPRRGSSNVVHASVTDHRILRRPAPPAAPKGLPPDATPLVVFRKGPHAPPDAELERDLGVALARLAERVPPDPGGTRQLVGRLARTRLTAALATWRGDADARVALSLARAACGEADERFRAASAALRLAPDSEFALTEYAESALGVGRFDRAADAATRLVETNPTSVDSLLIRATVASAQKNWKSAEEDCRAALRLHPLHPQARLMFAICLHNGGNPDAGRNEAETAIGLATAAQKSAFRSWYQRETR